MNKNKIYSIFFLDFTFACLVFLASFTIYIDPYFHYHTPNDKYAYTIDDDSQRYQNDGILRNFNYNALITGTSMTENFKTSEFDERFGVKSVKVSFKGGRYKEINDNISRALSYNKNLSTVIRSIDSNYYYTDANDLGTYFNEDYPYYLTNNNFFDDVNYWFNKSILLQKSIPIFLTSNEGIEYNFDVIYNWNDSYAFGKEYVLASGKRSAIVEDKQIPTKKEIDDFMENIEINIIEIVKKNPNVSFYYFIPPYSIVWWDNCVRENRLEKHLYAERMVIEALMEYENVHLFSFCNNFDLTTNLYLYKDALHYNENVNSYMLEKMSKGENRLTRDNYTEYLKGIYRFYSSYNYDSIYE